MTVFDRLDAARERWNVLRHPFYQRWTAGSLTRGELAFYAGEYRHAVVALAEQTSAAARAAQTPDARRALERHAGEEAAHVALWDRFADALEARADRPPRAETVACRAAWTAGDGLLDRLAVLYAIESAQPAISQTKLDGLRAHYGIGGEPAAYFALHAARDQAHAAESRRLIAERRAEADPDRLVAVGEAALAANWGLLDGVDAQAATAPR